MNSGLVACYRMTRQRLARKGFDASPARCLEIARAELARAGELAAFAYYPIGGGIGAANDRGGRWIERPADYGLRFVGWSDKLARLDHTGWYLQEDGFGGDTARGCVYQLPARNGRAIYVEAIRLGAESRSEGWQDMSGEPESALVFLVERHLGEPGGWDRGADIEAQGDAADGANREAEIYAEEERAYREASDAGFQASQKLGDAQSEREECRELLAELRAGASAGPRLCDAMRGLIREKLARARRLRGEVRLAIGEMAGAYSWNLRKRDILRDAFAESYGFPIEWDRF